MTPSLVISIAALLFTVGSFWWIQARRGELRTYPFHSYAGTYGPQTILSLPLVLHNTGPAPIVAIDFRLTLKIPDDEDFVMPWSAVQPALQPAGVNGGRTLPAPIAVPGRTAIERYIEFQCRRTLPIEPGPYTARIDVKLAHRQEWREFHTFQLHTELAVQDNAVPYIARTNDPEWSLD